MDNLFIKRLWKRVKYEDVYLKTYSSPGEMRKGLATPPPDLEFFALKSYQYVMTFLSVRDHGCGLHRGCRRAPDGAAHVIDSFI